MKKKLLILGGNQEALEGIKVLKKNFLTILVDGNKNCVSRTVCDYFINANIYNTTEIVKKLNVFLKRKKFKINGAIAIACDDVFTIATINKLYRLRGINLNQAKLTNDKIKFKKILDKHKINSPKYFVIKNFKEAEKKFKLFKSKKIIVKPPDNRGSRGVILKKKKDFSSKDFNKVLFFSKSNSVLVEEFIDGNQISAEAIVYEGNIFLAGISDRNYNIFKFTKPHMIEDGGETPSKYSKKFKIKIKNMLSKCINAINYKFGTIKADLIIKKNKVYIIEVALRLSGGDYSTITIPEVYGNNIIEMNANIITRQSVNLLDIKLSPKKFQSNRFLFLKEGLIKSINQNKIDRLSKNKNIKKISIDLKKGQKICKVTDHTKRNGTVMVLSDNAIKSKKLCEQFITTIKKSIRIS